MATQDMSQLKQALQLTLNADQQQIQQGEQFLNASSLQPK